MKSSFEYLFLLFYLVWSEPLLGQKAIFNRASGFGGLNITPVTSLAASDPGKQISVNILSTQLSASSKTAAFSLKSYTTWNADIVRNDLIGIADQSSGAGELDVTGPSIIFTLPTKTKVAIGTRLRCIGNYWNLNGRLVSEIGESSSLSNSYPHRIGGVSESALNVASFSDLSVTLSHQIWSDQKHAIHVAASVKYINGISNAIITFNDLAGNIKVNSRNLSFLTEASGTVSTNTSGSLTRLGDIVSLKKGSIGADLGIVFVQEGQADGTGKLIAGLSLNDIGNVRYENDSIMSKSYNIHIPKEQGLYFNNNFDNSSFSNTTKIFDRYPEFFTQTTRDNSTRKVGLPTSVVLNVLYNMSGRLALDGHALISTNKTGSISKLYKPWQVSVSPIILLGDLSVRVPVLVGKFNNVSSGVGVQYRGLHVGSNTLFSSLFKKARMLDFVLGYHIILK
jgi:hypothetical protein